MATHTVAWQEPLPLTCRGGAVAVGNFDGVHLGHSALLTTLKDRARAHAGPAVAVTFDPHPRELLHPGHTVAALTRTADRTQLLHDRGADEVVVLRATPDLLALSARDFFDRVLLHQLAARALVEGVNFRFGRGREGDVDVLQSLCSASGVELTIMQPVAVAGEEASSSRVRASLLAGDVAGAAVLLGRPYRLHGLVGLGRQRGATLGFPTANVSQPETLVPADGVYAARATTADGLVWPAAVNVGSNPTFSEDARKIEVHLIGFKGDLYGQPLAVDFLIKLRETRPFAGPADLVEQLRRDVDQARSVAAG